MGPERNTRAGSPEGRVMCFLGAEAVRWGKLRGGEAVSHVGRSRSGGVGISGWVATDVCA